MHHHGFIIMNDDKLETARKRAYRTSEEGEQPEGRHEPHWHRALKEFGLVPAADPGAGAIQAEARAKLGKRK